AQPELPAGGGDAIECRPGSGHARWTSLAFGSLRAPTRWSSLTFGSLRATCGRLLATLPDRAPLLGERARPFDEVLALDHRDHLVVGRLARLLDRSLAEALVGRLLRRPHRERRALEDLVGPAPRTRERLASRDHFVHEAEPVALLGEDAPAGAQHPHRVLERARARQAV